MADVQLIAILGNILAEVIAIKDAIITQNALAEDVAWTLKQIRDRDALRCEEIGAEK